MNKRTFGAAPDFDEGPTMDESPLADLAAEFAGPVRRITTARYELPQRPGWWAEFDTAYDSRRLRHLLNPTGGKDVDPLRLAFGLIAETCTAIGKGEVVVFATMDSPAGRMGPFRTRAIEEAVGASLTVRDGEKPWQSAIRWAFGAQDDDRPLIALLNDLQEANLVAPARSGDPTV